uniref:Uncharacterized protein n=1 Tax=Anopheles atroparvus TaxID=41427 RepID=A0AAG5CW55_ANOAO
MAELRKFCRVVGVWRIDEPKSARFPQHCVASKRMQMVSVMCLEFV